MKVLIASVLSLIFFSLAVLHIYWGFGGKRGKAASVPTKENNTPVINPRSIACFVVGIGLLGFGVLVLIKVGIILSALSGWPLDCGLWVIAAIFILRAVGEFRYVGFFKKIKATGFGEMDTRYYSPLCLLIGIFCVILEIVN